MQQHGNTKGMRMFSPILFVQQSHIRILLIKQYRIVKDKPYDSLVYTLCSSMGDVKYINQVLVHWRRHENASTSDEKESDARML